MENTAANLTTKSEIQGKDASSALKTLPGDDVRQIMWRFADRYDLQMVVQSARSVARGVVARLVANGARNTHEWTPEKAKLLTAFDEAGISSLFLDPDYGGFITGPKNLALSLAAFELAWVDAGAATCSLATSLALGPIIEKGTPEQRDTYMKRCSPSLASNGGKPWRGAFALTEPLPYIGVDTGVVGGRVRIAQWKEGQEPILQVDKRGRFITNMAFANFVTAAVTSDDPRLKGSCMVILEQGDPGVFDRGSPTLKMVHQLSSTRDPIFSLKVPASRIVGGYTIKDGVIIPNYNHGEIIEAVFLRTRVAPALMTAAKLLSAVEPIIRYQRQRFHGGDASSPGTPRYELGLQQKEDALLRLVDVWTTGEASASLGFAAARLVDEYEPLEDQKEEIFAQQGLAGQARAQMKALSAAEKLAMEYLDLKYASENEGNQTRLDELEADPLVRYARLSSLVNVLVPACKLWNTGNGTNMMREAVSLMGGYGITEDCPGFLGHKWMDAQLEATYEGPEAVQRRHLSVSMTNELFLKEFSYWIREMRRIGAEHPGTGACALASAAELWLFSFRKLLQAKDADGKALYHGKRQGVSFALADALCWISAARFLILDVLELKNKGPQCPTLADGIAGFVSFFTDLCHVQVARSAGEVGRICAELLFGYQHHPAWDGKTLESCYHAEGLDEMESIMPGIGVMAQIKGEVVEKNGLSPAKAGPCAQFSGMEQYLRLRTRLDGCLTGSRLAKDRAAWALTQVMIPEALDYPS